MTVYAHAIDPSLAGIITAVVGGVVGIGGLWLTAVGRREQARQQLAADAAAQDKHDLDQVAQALNAVQKRAELAETGEERYRLHVLKLEEQLDEERSLRRHLVGAQESRCREVTGELVEALITLRGVVVDEVAQSAAQTALQRHNESPHPHALPGPKPKRDEDDT